ncbi:MAG: hypothetical protein WCJ70_01700 [bacterium]
MRSKLSFQGASERMLTNDIGRIILYFIISTIATVVIFFANYILSVQTVEITSVGNPQIVVKDANKLIGRSMILTSDEEISKLLLAANPLFSSIQITRKYPQTILLEISESAPSAALYINDTLYILLTSEGKIVKSVFTRPEKLPVITYYQKLVTSDYELGTTIGYSEIRFATQISFAFLKSGIHDITIKIQDSAYIDVIRGGTHLLFSAKSDMQKQLGFLPDILKLLLRGTQEYSKIDFRFDKVIVE